MDVLMSPPSPGVCDIPIKSTSWNKALMEESMKQSYFYHLKVQGDVSDKVTERFIGYPEA